MFTVYCRHCEAPLSRTSLIGQQELDVITEHLADRHPNVKRTGDGVGAVLRHVDVEESGRRRG